MDKVSIIRELVRFHRWADLSELVEGRSKFTTARSSGVPDDQEERTAWVMALHHLRYAAEFGEQPSVEVNGKTLVAVPREEFEQWLQFGAPGVATEDVQDYLRENPL